MDWSRFLETKPHLNNVLSILAISFGIFLIYKIRELVKFRNAVNKIPGPKGIPIIGNVNDIVCPRDELFRMLKKYADMYYPIYRLNSGPETAVFLRSPDDIEFVISGMKNLQKSRMYETLGMWLKEGLLVSTGLKWQKRRKLLTPTFHFNILNQFTCVFIEQTGKLIQDIEKTLNEPTDVLSVISQFTLRSICETAMGTRLSQAKSHQKYVQAIHRMGHLAVYRITRPWFYNAYAYIFSKKFWETLLTSKYLHNFSMKVIKERERNFNQSDLQQDADSAFITKKRLAMLDLLISFKQSENSFDYNGIQEEVDTFMFEGHDTTATSISFTLMLLACNPQTQDKVVEELRDIFGNSKREMTMQDLNEMKYLERVLKESLRLYPSVAMIGRVNSEDVILPSGYTIPAGSNVMLHIFHLHHDAKYYPDPEKFDPDRFLPEHTKNRHPYAYIPFSAGPRNCIGQKFALLEMKTVITAIMRNFQLEPCDTPENLCLQSDLILRNKKKIQVIFRPRLNL